MPFGTSDSRGAARGGVAQAIRMASEIPSSGPIGSEVAVTLTSASGQVIGTRRC